MRSSEGNIGGDAFLGRSNSGGLSGVGGGGGGGRLSLDIGGGGRGSGGVGDFAPTSGSSSSSSGGGGVPTLTRRDTETNFADSAADLASVGY